jgi:hypothetical protein
MWIARFVRVVTLGVVTSAVSLALAADSMMPDSTGVAGGTARATLWSGTDVGLAVLLGAGLIALQLRRKQKGAARSRLRKVEPRSGEGT